MATGEVSFEQWCYESQTLSKTYSDSASRDGMQRSLRGVAADTVHNMRADVSLDYIIKMLTITYGRVYESSLIC